MNLQAVVLALCVSTVLADQAAEPGCTTEDGKTIPKGQQYDAPGLCQRNACIGNNEWTRVACGLVGGPLGWRFIPEDPTKPYPQCCGYLVPPLDIVPDVLSEIPGKDYLEYLEIQYPGGAKVEQGNELTPTQVKHQPSVNFTAKPEGWYLLCMTDPDAPSRQEPTDREFKHWLVGNIPGNNVSGGEILAEYIGAGPPQGTGLHRYVFLLYKQPQKITFDEQKVSKTSIEGRRHFSIQKFAEKYKLGKPTVVNVFQAQYDDYVPELKSQLTS